MTPAAMTLFFHEFGHVIHGLAVGDREWILLQLERDFFEVPSQLLEEWSTDPSVLATFARHHQTNEPVPPALLQRMRRASELTRGIVVRNDALQAAFSLSLHSGDPAGMDPDEIYRDLLSVHLPHPYTLVEGVHPVASLLYVGNQNAASRYRYLWGEVITKDLFSQFDRSNLLGPAIARRYKETVLAPSGSKPAAELVQDFLGRPFDVTAWESWLNGRRQ
jgi:thimet oligopeptidase